jgi:hypothetical protein
MYFPTEVLEKEVTPTTPAEEDYIQNSVWKLKLLG